MTSSARRYAEPRGPMRIGLGGPELIGNSYQISVGVNPKIFFQRKLQVIIRPHAEGLSCEIPKLDILRYPSNRSGASQVVATALWEETDKLLSTLTHELNAEQRARKRLLLGNVDILPSGLVRDVAPFAWVLGTIEVDGSGRRFRALGSRAECYEFAVELPHAIPTDSFVRLAKVRAGAIGEPIGPVVELERPLGIDPEATWATWERKLDGHE
jgi:hypothetical protein